MFFENYIILKNYNKIYNILKKNLIGKLVKKGNKINAIKLFNSLKY